MAAGESTSNIRATYSGGADARRGPRAWYLGSTVGLLWLAFPISILWTTGLPLAAALLGQLLLIAWAAVYVLVPPLFWSATLTRKIAFTTVFFASTLVFLPFVGTGVTTLWVFVAIAFAMTAPPISVVAVLTAAIALLSFIVIAFGTGEPASAIWLPLITFALSMMMATFARQIDLVHRLRDSQAETARLAVEQERSRVARDIHDILGHSLTVITVKAELAGRLLPGHPEKARSEVGDIEMLARVALADVRATVTGYRGVNLATELSSARMALNSAGIEAELPNNIESVPVETSELFAWVVREGVTNVVRHSSAARCVVTLAQRRIEIVDDGRGGVLGERDGHKRGNGLQGLAERVVASGGTLSAGPGATSGFVLSVSV